MKVASFTKGWLTEAVVDANLAERPAAASMALVTSGAVMNVSNHEDFASVCQLTAGLRWTI